MRIQKLGLLLLPLMLTNRAVTDASAQQTQQQRGYVSDNDSGQPPYRRAVWTAKIRERPAPNR